MLLAGIALILFSCAAWVWSMLMLSRANLTARIPWWGRPPRNPGRSILLTIAASGCLIFGVNMSSQALGLPEGAVVLLPALLGTLGPVAVIVLHNRCDAAADTR